MKKGSGEGRNSTPTSLPNAFRGIVKGRVQGVGYRVFAREAATRHRVGGWVRNLRDGTVEIYAEADEIILTEFLTDLYRGPIMGHVADIVLEWIVCEPSHQSFEILR
ncbi:acylphosphatase [bacterium]|nr:acylphosphatase [bacterium]